jgi:hypothetical protein
MQRLVGLATGFEAGFLLGVFFGLKMEIMFLRNVS